MAAGDIPRRKSRKRKNSEDSNSATPSRTLKVDKPSLSTTLLLCRIHCNNSIFAEPLENCSISPFAVSSATVFQQYSIEEKLEIIDFAKNNGNRAAGREYNVAESSIREWRKNEDKLRALSSADPERHRLSGGGRKTTERVDSDGEAERVVEIVHVPLSQSLLAESVFQASPSNHPDVLEESLRTSSSSSSHSNSPIPSHLPGSSSRRKNKIPRKMVIDV
uniref:BrkDBD domain-containing protein n=1 Tax=Heterorhabditis bacteriophora TaxID=37862 RepID=A0A1I7XM73_HETBA